MTAYYNEIDTYAAQWLCNLIEAGHIARGVVDTRSIEDVLPSDLAGFTQCHFFAGIGVWSYALRRAGWADDRPVWTGSCPCQPFSAAGEGAGFADERHLWPAWHHLIHECRPRVVFGEQVASRDGLIWIDLVHADMEASSYAFGAVDLCAAGVRAPHIRQRLFFVGYADDRGSGRDTRAVPRAQGSAEWGMRSLADGAQPAGPSRLLADAGGAGRGIVGRRGLHGQDARRDADPHHEVGALWSRVEWVECRDGKRRPVEPGTFPLVARSAFDVGSIGPYGGKRRSSMLKGYGNAINAEAARVFIEAAAEHLSGSGE